MWLVWASVRFVWELAWGSLLGGNSLRGSVLDLNKEVKKSLSASEEHRGWIPGPG